MLRILPYKLIIFSDFINNSEIIIDRPKGTAHPRFPDFIYRVDYGYLKNTASMDGAGIDIWVGTGGKKIDAIMCIVDLMKKDSEIKILIGCTEEEKAIVYADKVAFENGNTIKFQNIGNCVVYLGWQ